MVSTRNGTARRARGSSKLVWSHELRNEVEELFDEAQRLGRRRRRRVHAPLSVKQMNGGLEPAMLDLLMALTVTPRVHHAAKKVGLQSSSERRASAGLLVRDLVELWKQDDHGKPAWHARVTQRGWRVLLQRERVPRRRVFSTKNPAEILREVACL
jgi:hypothetical protein